MRTSERGIALIATLLIMLLMSALMVGFTTVVMSDQKFRGIDRDRSQAFYGAHSGLEKMTVDLFNLFSVSIAPTVAQLTALTASPPSIPGITYTAADGSAGLKITGQAPVSAVISSGSSPYQGMIALKTIYDIDSTARTAGSGEVHLTRRVETVAIPVFQFGMFSEVDLSFFAGPNFDFGGRVHTNGNLFLAEGASGTLTIRDRVTAVGEVVRQALSNGNPIATSTHTGAVSMAQAPNVFRNLLDSEGSLTGALGSSANASWPTISLSTYNSYIRNTTTGARPLRLPIATTGGANTDLVRRPLPNENVTNPGLLAERMFTKTSLRVLLSDAAADITNLPGVTVTAPVLLDGNWNVTVPNNGTAYGPISGARPPVARSQGLVTATMTNAAVNPNAAAVINLTAAIPAQWKPAPMTVTVLGITHTINCQGRDNTPRFLSCTSPTGPVAIALGSTLSATINSVVYTTVTNGLAVTVPAPGGLPPATISVAVGAGTTTLLQRWFWAGPQLVTCNGNATGANQMTGCTVVSTIPANTVLSSNFYTPAGTGTIGGFLKVERQTNAGVWQDVTMEILNYGIGGPNLAGGICADPTPNAILRIQRLRDNSGTCNYAGSTDAWNHWPNTLFDMRGGLQRDVVPAHTNVLLGGVMHYIALDVRNLSLWFQGAGAFAGGTGNTANNDGGAGYSVYFSDRRNNRNQLSQETGEYGWEDFVNPESPTGTPNGTLDTGEDVNGDGVLQVYGGVPNFNGVYNSVVAGSSAPLTTAAGPTTQLVPPAGKQNRAILFRHALKLVNGGLGNLVMPGLTVVTENPVYVQGDYNANAAGFGDPHAEASVIADAVTLLSNNWNDTNSFGTTANPTPFNMGNRPRAASSWYRLAIIAGKGMSFPLPAGTAVDFGTDGGAHNYLRYLEGGGQTVNYRGSLVTFYYNRQATGTYKCCATVYGAPTRNYAFDADFLNPATLPPLTPVFRDLDSLSFSEEKRPGL